MHKLRRLSLSFGFSKQREDSSNQTSTKQSRSASVDPTRARSILRRAPDSSPVRAALSDSEALSPSPTRKSKRKLVKKKPKSQQVDVSRGREPRLPDNVIPDSELVHAPPSPEPSPPRTPFPPQKRVPPPRITDFPSTSDANVDEEQHDEEEDHFLAEPASRDSFLALTPTPPITSPNPTPLSFSLGVIPEQDERSMRSTIGKAMSTRSGEAGWGRESPAFWRDANQPSNQVLHEELDENRRELVERPVAPTPPSPPASPRAHNVESEAVDEPAEDPSTHSPSESPRETALSSPAPPSPSRDVSDGMPLDAAAEALPDPGGEAAHEPVQSSEGDNAALGVLQVQTNLDPDAGPEHEMRAEADDEDVSGSLPAEPDQDQEGENEARNMQHDEAEATEEAERTGSPALHINTWDHASPEPLAPMPIPIPDQPPVSSEATPPAMEDSPPRPPPRALRPHPFLEGHAGERMGGRVSLKPMPAAVPVDVGSEEWEGGDEGGEQEERRGEEERMDDEVHEEYSASATQRYEEPDEYAYDEHAPTPPDDMEIHPAEPYPPEPETEPEPHPPSLRPSTDDPQHPAPSSLPFPSPFQPPTEPYSLRPAWAPEPVIPAPLAPYPPRPPGLDSLFPTQVPLPNSPTDSSHFPGPGPSSYAHISPTPQPPQHSDPQPTGPEPQSPSVSRTPSLSLSLSLSRSGSGSRGRNVLRKRPSGAKRGSGRGEPRFSMVAAPGLEPVPIAPDGEYAVEPWEEEQRRQARLSHAQEPSSQPHSPEVSSHGHGLSPTAPVPVEYTAALSPLLSLSSHSHDHGAANPAASLRTSELEHEHAGLLSHPPQKRVARKLSKRRRPVGA